MPMEGRENNSEMLSIPTTPNGNTSPLTPQHIWTASPSTATPHYSPSATNLNSPKVGRSPRTPLRNVFINMKSYLEDIGHITKLNPQEAWLPITESRTGNAFYSAFHNLNAGIGFQALLLPVALTFLGWTWGVISLVLAFIWQLYTLWILTQLHEAVPGKRHSRYVELAQEAFGPRLGAWLAIFPVMNLSAGTTTSLIIFGGGALELFYKTVCGNSSCPGHAPTTVEWYLVFAVMCAILAQLPNLNSIAGISIVGAITAIGYTTLVWTLSVSRPKLMGVSYSIVKPGYPIGTAFSTLNALGIIAFAFRGHNLALEIQGTMPSTLKHPAYIPMWRGVKAAYGIVALCYFPLAIAGYWAYGNRMLPSGILFSMYAFHGDIARPLMALTFLLVVLNSVGSFQIYAIPIFDVFEQGYTSKRNKACPKVVRVTFRLFFVFFGYFIAVAIPFISSFAGFLGGLTSIPVTFCYPCFMWLRIKKPAKLSLSWYVNWFLGILGIIFSLTFTAGGIWSIVDSGLTLNFFKP